MSTLLSGIAASSGIAIAKAYRLDDPILLVKKRNVKNSDEEIDRFQKMLRKSKKELTIIRENAKQHIGGNEAAIFDAHLLVLGDPDFLTSIVNKIQTEKINAEFALQETVKMFVEMFEQSDNLLIRERTVDIHDVKNRLLAHLLGIHLPNPSLIVEDVIIIAKDLTPSDTVQLNHQFVKGFATERGANSSHSAIIARSLSIPAVVGMEEDIELIEHGAVIIVDGFRGQVHINPTPELVKQYEMEQITRESDKKQWNKYIDKPTVTKDGHQVTLAANIVAAQEVENIQLHGAEGIGLFRTEFLFMGRERMPSEEEQFETYKAILTGMKGKPVIIRTLDIGGDKAIPYLNLPFENNPFLGYRAIRYSLKERIPFETQLRALLRASVFGNVKIMFPMIATLPELRAAKKIVHKVKQELMNAGTDINEAIEVGIMVEVPVTALMADTFAKEVDFFSIGTNDLIQYTMAADRMNEQVAYLYQPYNPAVFRLINMVIQAAHKEGKKVSLCGEMAGDEIAIPILLGLGLDELSMNANSILQVRSYIYHLSQTEVRLLSQKVLNMETADDVQALVQQVLLNQLNKQ
jgi:phosphotransferase system enzyme I (PtsI)